MESVHPSAIVHPTAQLGCDVVIGPYAIVEENTVLGDRTQVHAHSCILAGTRLGVENTVCHHSVIGGAPQVVTYDGRPTELVIGDHNVFREYTNINRSTDPALPTRIGNYCYLMAHAHVGHHCQVADRVVICNNSLLAGHCEVGERTFISGNVVLHQFTRIGRLAMLGGLSAVHLDVPPFTMAVGSRPCQLFGLNIVGLRRANFEARQRRALQDAFHHIFRPPGESFQDALDSVLNEEAARGLDEPTRALVEEMVEFCRHSKRGILRAIPRFESEQSQEPTAALKRRHIIRGSPPLVGPIESANRDQEGLGINEIQLTDRYVSAEEMARRDDRRHTSASAHQPE